MIGAILLFACWEGAMFAAAIGLARAIGFSDRDRWLAVLAIDVTLESSLAALFSFTHSNSPAAYWISAAILAVAGLLLLRRAPRKIGPGTRSFGFAAIAGLAAPLILLSFRPVEEIDSMNYLHYLMEWMGNRATPYTFATNYVPFWELSFLPTWMVTRVDFFFPLLALKAVVLLALAAWLVGRELDLHGALLLWTVFGIVALRCYWFQSSGVPTLKNDALHGAGFLLLLLVMLRARVGLRRTDLLMLAFALAFVTVKYTGIFLAVIALAVILFLTRRSLRANPARGALIAAGLGVFFLLTSGHYYLRSLIAFGSPFYPFQINLGPIHLAGTADLSRTSILYSLRDSRLWRAFFLPEGGISVAGLLFPVVLAATLLLGAAQLIRRRATEPKTIAALFILCGWLLYFRSVFSASAFPGDLRFVLHGMNSIRYVDGVLAASELWLVSLLAPFPSLACALVAINLASRLYLLYPHSAFPWTIALVAAALVFLLFAMAPRRYAVVAGAVCLVAATPAIVSRNRKLWTVYWDPLKPAIAAARGPDLAVLVPEDGGFYEGQAMAAGNPVHLEVRAMRADEVARARPRHLAVLFTSADLMTNWRAREAPRIASLGYTPEVQSDYGALYLLATNEHK